MTKDNFRILKKRPKRKKIDKVIEESGIKYDSGKRQWSLIPYKELEDILKILEFGAKKYSIDNWKKIKDAPKRYFEALMRHVLEWKNGVDKGISNINDKESGHSSLAHAGCCLLFLLWHAKKEGKEKEKKKGEKK